MKVAAEFFRHILYEKSFMISFCFGEIQSFCGFLIVDFINFFKKKGFERLDLI